MLRSVVFCHLIRSLFSLSIEVIVYRLYKASVFKMELPSSKCRLRKKMLGSVFIKGGPVNRAFIFGDDK
jgi:hypothetical protein